MRAEEVAAFYTQPGKQQVRKFVVDLAAAAGCKTALDFWGGGTSAKALAEAGLDVTSAEVDRSLWSELDRAAARDGYAAHHGRASTAHQGRPYDLVWADFTGHVSDKQERELRALMPVVGRFLVVTILPERESDAFLVRARVATIPAWLMYVTGLGIDYITRYQRNRRNGEMWLAVLSRRAGRGRPVLHPTIMGLNLRHQNRRYWASSWLTRQHPELLPYVTSVQTRGVIAERKCAACGVLFTPLRNNRAKWCHEAACRRARNNQYGRQARSLAKKVYPARSCLYCQLTFRPWRPDQKCCSMTHNRNYNSRAWYRVNGRRDRKGQRQPALPIAA